MFIRYRMNAMDVEEWTKIDTKNDGFFVSRLEVRRLLMNVER
jgi:hypothetical protein